MSDKFTYKHDISLGLNIFLKPHVSAGATKWFGAHPEASYDNHGNHHFANSLVCSDKSVLPFTDADKDAAFASIRAATMGQSPERKREGGLSNLSLTGTLEETYDLGNLPSPLQTLCEKTGRDR